MLVVPAVETMVLPFSCSSLSSFAERFATQRLAGTKCVMVIEPESLIFFSVPSWALAAAAKPSAAAASRATAFFIAPPWGDEKFYLLQRRRGIAQPLGHGREQRDAERRLR